MGENGLWKSDYLKNLVDNNLCLLVNSKIAPDLHNNSDKIVWNLQSNGEFSVKSGYGCKNQEYPIDPIFMRVWNVDVPERVKVFIWLIAHNRVLTWELCNNWFGGYAWCHQCLSIVGSSSHVFRDCPIATVVWNSLVDT